MTSPQSIRTQPMDYHGKPSLHLSDRSQKCRLLTLLSETYGLLWSQQSSRQVLTAPSAPAGGMVALHQSTGYPVWLFLTRQFGEAAALLIERRAKPGHDAPRMFLLDKLSLDPVLFIDTLLDGELYWDAGIPRLLMHDIPVDMGCPIYKSVSYGKRRARLAAILEGLYDHVPSWSWCSLELKLLASEVATYPVRGTEYHMGATGQCLFVPLAAPRPPRPVERAPPNSAVVPSADTGATTAKLIQNTEKVDVYNVLDMGSRRCIGTAAVLTMEDSLRLAELCSSGPDPLPMRCMWHEGFQKWSPIV